MVVDRMHAPENTGLLCILADLVLDYPVFFLFTWTLFWVILVITTVISELPGNFFG